MSPIPRVLLWLLRLRVRSDWLEFVLGDLQEGMMHRGGSTRRARRWMWWQAVRVILRPPDAASLRALAWCGIRHVRGAAADVRYATRVLRRSPWYAATAIGVVALSTAFGTGVFAMVDGVLFDDPPYARPGELYVLNGGFHKLPGFVMQSVSTPDVDAWSAAAGPALELTRMTVGGGVPISDNEYLRSAEIDDRFFDVLGIAPLIGGFSAVDFQDRGTVRPALITYRVWQHRFQADPNVIGRTLMDSKGAGLRVGGVLPDDFVYPHPAGVIAAEVLVPIRQTMSPTYQNPQRRWLYVIGRLSPRMPLADLVPLLDAAAARVAATYPPLDSTERVSPTRQITRGPFDRVIVRPLGSVLTESTRPIAAAVFGAFGALLLLASLNLAGLSAGRVLDRQRELALRRALGATRGRVVRMLFAEHAVVIAAGGALGVAGSRLLLDVSMSLAPAGLMLLKSPTIDMRAIVFTSMAAALSLVTATIWSARAGSRVTERAALSEGGATTQRGRSRGRMVLISAQVAAALVLVTAGLLFGGSLMRAWAEDTGFQRWNTARLRVFPGPSFGVPAITELLDAIDAMPGVLAAGGLNEPFLERAITGSAFEPPAGALPLHADVENLAVTSGFFRAAGLTLIEGRLPTREEFEGGRPAIVVSRTIARSYWPHQSALGKPLRRRQQTYEVIAVVEDARYRALDADPEGEIYSPIAEQPGLANIIVALEGKPAQRLAEIVAMIQTRFPRVRVARAETMQEALGASIQWRRFQTWLFVALGGAGVAVAAVGILGLVALSVARRTREVGVRMALGATRRRVVLQMLGEQLIPVATGLVAGGILSAWALRFLQEFAYKLSVYDPRVWVTAVLVIVTAAAIGSLAPVLRATRVDPVSALRAE